MPDEEQSRLNPKEWLTGAASDRGGQPESCAVAHSFGRQFLSYTAFLRCCKYFCKYFCGKEVDFFGFCDILLAYRADWC